jgi:outer membrane lipoprotein-sorting protein
MRKQILLSLACVLFTAFSNEGHCEITARELIDRVDKMYRWDSSEGSMTMKVETPDWTREMALEIWSKGEKKTFIRILAPKKDRGVATLRVAKEMWNYFPKINKVVKVPPSMMMGSWMGSDLTNDDLVRETSLVDEYDATLKTLPDSYFLTLVPKAETATVWGRIEMTIDRASSLPIEQTYYNEKGVKVRIQKYLDVKTFDGKKLPSRMEMIPLSKPGNKTSIVYEKIRFNTRPDEEIFSLRNLQKRL